MHEARRKQPQFLFLITGSRADGNSELLAERAARSLEPGVARRWWRLLDDPLPPFADIRHQGDGTYTAPAGRAGELLEATLAATDIVFVAPLYWYGLPAAAKLYLDHWSGWMRVPEVGFTQRMAGKNLWAITALSDLDYSVADPLIDTLRLSADYMKMNWRGALLGYGNRPSEVLADSSALAKADWFFANHDAVPAGNRAAHA